MIADDPAGRPLLPRRFWWRVVVAVARRPRLWAVAVAQAWRLARPGWWRTWPPLPRPDAAYLGFRLETMYGHPVDPAGVEVEHALAYLRWCRDFPG